MTAEDITVELRLEKLGNDWKGFADVTLSLGEYGILTLQGFSISGDPPRVCSSWSKGHLQMVRHCADARQGESTRLDADRNGVPISIGGRV